MSDQYERLMTAVQHYVTVVALDPGVPKPEARIAVEREARILEASAKAAMIERCFGQRDPHDGDAMLFVVRVHGIGAKPDSPRHIARTLTQNWSQRWPDVSFDALIVQVADDILDQAQRDLAALIQQREEG